MKSSRIDQTKILVNSALVKCLQDYRSNTNNKLDNSIPSEEIISNDLLNGLGYQIKQNQNKCSGFYIEPTNENDKILYTYGFDINQDGLVRKIAFPADDSFSLKSCKAWGGINCGASEEQKAIWEAEKRLAAAKKSCNEKFNNWLNNTPPSGGTGTFNRWDNRNKKINV